MSCIMSPLSKLRDQPCMTGPAFEFKNRPPSKPLKKAQMEGASFFTRPCAHGSHTYIAYFVSPFPPTRMYSPCCPDVHTVLLYRLISHGLVLISEWWGSPCCDPAHGSLLVICPKADAC